MKDAICPFAHAGNTLNAILELVVHQLAIMVTKEPVKSIGVLCRSVYRTAFNTLWLPRMVQILSPPLVRNAGNRSSD